MSRYIDIDDERNCFIGMDGDYEKYNIEPDVLKEAIDLVRCKDCERGDASRLKGGRVVCQEYDVYMYEDDYCSGGCRRES